MSTDLLRPKGSALAWTWEKVYRKGHVTLSIAGGESAAHVYDVAAGILPIDLHIDIIGVTLENPPGTDKTVTVTVSDGTAVMTVEIAGDTDTSGFTLTNNFDLDVSEKTLSIALTATGGTAAGSCSILTIYHEVAI